MEFSIPASIFIAPPTLFSARFLYNVALVNVKPSTFPWKLIAPPSSISARLFSNLTLLKISDVDVLVIYNAPPLP